MASPRTLPFLMDVEWTRETLAEPVVIFHGKEKAAICGGFSRALCRTRTGDPFLTMEVLYQLS